MCIDLVLIIGKFTKISILYLGDFSKIWELFDLFGDRKNDMLGDLIGIHTTLTVHNLWLIFLKKNLSIINIIKKKLQKILSLV